MTTIFQLLMWLCKRVQTKDRVKKVSNRNQAFTPNEVSGLDSKNI